MPDLRRRQQAEYADSSLHEQDSLAPMPPTGPAGSSIHRAEATGRPPPAQP